MAGHASFLLLALSYLENNFMHLRAYAFTGITFSIIFQYYRDKPLWIPIRWNLLFLFINGAMITALVWEERDAQNIPDEQKQMYESIFKRHGMKPVDFMHLMSLAKRQTIECGEMLVAEGQKNHCLHVVRSGSFLMKKGRDVINHIERHRFVGTLSFLRWQEHHVEDKISADDDNLWEYQAGGDTYLLLSFLANLLFATADDDGESQSIPFIRAQNHEDEGQEAQFDVVSDESCVVYTWEFEDLQRLIVMQPSLGIVFERCLYLDINQKMSERANIEQRSRRRAYEDLIAWAVSDGRVGDKEKSLLVEFRAKNSISTQDHEQLLASLGWTPEDFERGSKR